MGQLDIESREIQATIVYFGAQDAGTTSNLRFIQRKLRKDHRGELVSEHEDGNPEAPYESLQLQLGEVQGVRTSIRLQTVPTGLDQSEARRRLLAGVDGIVFVADLRLERQEATLQAFEELTQHLASYGRSLDDLVLLLQPNRLDQADENALDLLHSNLGRKPVATVEASAHDGTGVLQTLTSISRLVLADIRGRANSESQRIDDKLPGDEEPPRESVADLVFEEPLPGDPWLEPTQSDDSFVEPARTEDPSVESERSTGVTLEEPRPEEPGSVDPKPGFRIESTGPAETDGREIRLPIRLVAQDTDQRIELCLRLNLDDG